MAQKKKELKAALEKRPARPQEHLLAFSRSLPEVQADPMAGHGSIDRRRCD